LVKMSNIHYNGIDLILEHLEPLLFSDNNKISSTATQLVELIK